MLKLITIHEDKYRPGAFLFECLGLGEKEFISPKKASKMYLEDKLVIGESLLEEARILFEACEDK